MKNNPKKPAVRHFLSLNDLTAAEIKELLNHSIELKKERYKTFKIAKHKNLALIFEASSTRTRVSFETGFNQLGGDVLFLFSKDVQIGRGEAISDTAKVISRMVDMVAARIIDHKSIEQLAQFSQVPVINALSNRFHPCQILADLLTFNEKRGSIEGAKITWVGDGNNVCHSWMNAAKLLNFNLAIATPQSHQPDEDLIKLNQSNVKLFSDDKNTKEAIFLATKDADVVVTDTWVSMGDEDNKNQRLELFKPYKVTAEVMKNAHKDAIFMHCLPAYRGLEVDAEVIDGNQSVVWDEAENRLHAQKALILFLLNQ